MRAAVGIGMMLACLSPIWVPMAIAFDTATDKIRTCGRECFAVTRILEITSHWVLHYAIWRDASLSRLPCSHGARGTGLITAMHA